MKQSYIREPLGEAKPMYVAYNEAMTEMFKKNDKIVLLYGDFPRGAAGEMATKEYPDRVYDTGIAEANLITVGAGMAAAGKIPFTHCHSIFAVGRAYNQIRQNVAFDKFNVKMLLLNTGMLWAFMGGSHQTIEEITALRVIPNLVIFSPSDPVETKKIAQAALDHVGPVAIRLPAPPAATIYQDNFPFQVGKAVTVTEGKDATIIVTGILLGEALKAYDLLAKEKVSVRLLDMHTIKPIDEAAIIKAAKDTGAIITVEDTSILGGLGGAVAEVTAENQPVPLKRVGVKDRFGQSATVDELKEVYELSANHIVKAVKEVLKRKKK